MTTILINDSGEIRAMTYVPEEPKYKVNCGGTHACTCASLAFENGANRDVVDGYDDNCPHRYKSALEKAKSESLPFDRPEDIEKIARLIGLSGTYSKSQTNRLYQVPVEVEVVEMPMTERVKCGCPCHKHEGVKHVVECCDDGFIETPFLKKVARIIQPKPEPVESQEDLAVKFAMYMSGKCTIGDQDYFRQVFRNKHWTTWKIDN